jgi:hypothetical protein
VSTISEWYHHSHYCGQLGKYLFPLLQQRQTKVYRLWYRKQQRGVTPALGHEPLGNHTANIENIQAN